MVLLILDVRIPYPLFSELSILYSALNRDTSHF